MAQLQHELRMAAQSQADALQGLAGWLQQPPPAPATPPVAQPYKMAPRGINPPRSGAVSAERSSNESSTAEARSAGNSAFRSGNYQQAVEWYTRSIAAEPTDELSLSNRAMAHLKLSQWNAAEADATEALRLNPTHVKSWHRRASARRALGRIRDALLDASVAARLLALSGDAAQLAAAAATVDAVDALEAEARECRRNAPPVELAVHVARDTGTGTS